MKAALLCITPSKYFQSACMNFFSKNIMTALERSTLVCSPVETLKIRGKEY